MDTKIRPICMLSTKSSLQTSRHIYTERERMEKVFHANGKQKKAGVAILISDKIDLKIKKITRDKEGHYIMIKGSIQEEDIIIVISMQPTLEHLNTQDKHIKQKRHKYIRHKRRN